MKNVQTCIETALACLVECEKCTIDCLEEGNKKCVSICRDCADICGLFIKLSARGSRFADAVCELCRQSCAACADECSKHDMECCKRCAEACKKCAETCKCK